MKAKYDFVFGLGMACSCTETLREAKLQYLSLPFDWLTTVSDAADVLAADMPLRAREIADGFRTWFAKNDFRYLISSPETGKDLYCIDRLGLLFNHDFPLGAPYDVTFEKVLAKYRRRIVRLLERIVRSKRVLVVRMDRPNAPYATSEQACRQAQAILRHAFPDVQFDILHFAYEKGLDFRSLRQEDLGDGLLRVTFDYKNNAPGSPPYQVNLRQTSGLLRKWYEAPDYRTPEDKREYKHLRRLKRYRKFGAKNGWEYLWLRLRAALGRR